MGKSFSKLTPRIANTFFLLALQHFFTNHPEHPWHPDDSISKLSIATDFTEDPRVQDSVPNIVIRNGPCTIDASGFGSGIYSARERQAIIEGQKVTQKAIWDYKMDFTINSYTEISVISFSKDDSDELAFEVAMFMAMLKSYVGNILKLQNLGNPQQSPAQQMTQVGWSGKYMASVTVPYTFILCRHWNPVDAGILLRSVETIMKPVNPDRIPPKPGDKDEHGNDINIGEVGGTNTGGENGNWGGKGGISDDPNADGIDDNVVTLRFRAREDTIEGYQPGQPMPNTKQV